MDVGLGGAELSNFCIFIVSFFPTLNDAAKTVDDIWVTLGFFWSHRVVLEHENYVEPGMAFESGRIMSGLLSNALPKKQLNLACC